MHACGVNVAQSGRARAADGLLLIALCLGTWAGTVAPSATGDALGAAAIAAVVVALALYVAERRTDPERAPGTGRIAPLAVASALAWGTLGVGAAARAWLVAAVGLVAAALLTWRLLGALGVARDGV